jgi:EF-hand domain pair/EF hand
MCDGLITTTEKILMKRTTLATLIGAAALVIAVPFAAQAERGHGRHGPDSEHMKAIDTNGDGDISKEEIQAHRTTMFNAADANQDGALTLDEMTAHHETMQAQRKAERQARMFEKLDTDGNGTVSASEFASRPMRGMDRFDTDGDGVVSEEERAAAKATMKDHRGKWGRHGDRRAPDSPDAPDGE